MRLFPPRHAVQPSLFLSHSALLPYQSVSLALQTSSSDFLCSQFSCGCFKRGAFFSFHELQLLALRRPGAGFDPLVIGQVRDDDRVGRVGGGMT